MSDRVTWLIPVKNGMPYLPETLASIEAQTYRNWEVLIWDNGSTDGTLEELKKWVPDRLPGRVVTDQPLGVGGSLAKMVERCQTEFCARIDADDICLPHRLEKQVAYLLSHPEIAVVGSQMHIIEHSKMTDGIYNTPLAHDDIVHYLFGLNCMAHPSVLFRRSAILDVGNYRDLPCVEDYDLWMRVAARYRLANLDLPLVYYRSHDNNATNIYAQQNKLQELTDNCFIKNAPLLFGCTEHEARLLISFRHPLAIQTFFKIAIHLHRTQGGTLLNRLRSDSFIHVSRCYTSSSNIVSRLAIASLRPRQLLRGVKQRLKLKFAA